MRRPPILNQPPNDGLRQVDSLFKQFAALEVTSVELDQLMPPGSAAINQIVQIVRTGGRVSCLTPELLAKINGAALPADVGRLEHTCEWFAADSFSELNPIEQAAIAYLRLLSIPSITEETARAAASLFTMRAGLPFIVFASEKNREAAVQEGEKVNTQPMVDAISRSVAAMLEQMIARIKELRKAT